MSINGGLKNTLTLVHFQMEAAEITLVSSDVWHKQLLCCPTENQRLQIMWFWGEVMCCFFFNGLGICSCLQNGQTQDILLEAHPEFCSGQRAQTSRVLHSFFTGIHQPICPLYVSLEQSIWLNLLSGNQCEETTQHNWYKMWCFLGGGFQTHTHTESWSTQLRGDWRGGRCCRSFHLHMNKSE